MADEMKEAIVVAVGSRVTCNPPPTDTDEDYLCLVRNMGAAVKGLLALGFEYSADPVKVKEYEDMAAVCGGRFCSLFFGDINYILTDNSFFFERFLTATHVCKVLNLMKKEDRIMVFGAIRGGSFYKELCPDWKPDYGDFHMGRGGMLFDPVQNEKLNQAVSTIGSTQVPTPVPLDAIHFAKISAAL